MTIKQINCFVLHCDICGGTDDCADFIPHFDTEEDARGAFADFDSSWTSWKGVDWCPECNPDCICGDFFGEHEYGEEGGSECECDGFQLSELSLKESSS